MHNQYSPLWKCSKLFIPPQTDGMIRFCFNIGCSESKGIFKWRRTKTTHKGKKAFREANVHTLCISFSLSQNSLSDKQTQSNTVNTQKSPPWACDNRCAEACAERFSALNMTDASSAVLFIIGLRRAGTGNWVKYAILRVGSPYAYVYSLVKSRL